MKETKAKIILLVFAVFMGSPLLAREQVLYQGMSVSNEETEAALPSLLPADKCCDRQVNAQRDRSPHGMSPQEAHDLVRRTLTPRRASPPRPAGKSQKGSR